MRAAPLVGALATGVFGAACIVVSRSVLDLDQFTPVATIWTMWALSAAAFTFSAQQVVISAVRHSGGTRGWYTQRSAAVVLASSILLFIACLALRERLFGAPTLAWPLMAAVLPFSSALVGVARGLAAAVDRTRLLAAVIVADNAARFVMITVLAAIGAGASWFGLAIVLGFIVVLPAITLVDRGTPRPDPKIGASTIASPSNIGVTSAFAGLTSQLIVTGPPLVLAVSGAPGSEVSTLFLLLTCVRLPFLAAQGMVPTIAVRINDRLDDVGRSEHRFRDANLQAWVIGFVCVTAAVGIAGWAIGSPVIRVLFDIEVAGWIIGSAAAASVVAVTNLLLTVVMAVVAQARDVMTAWLLPLIGLTAWLFIVAESTAAATVGLVAAEAVILIGLAACAVRADSASSTDQRASLDPLREG